MSLNMAVLDSESGCQGTETIREVQKCTLHHQLLAEVLQIY